MTVMNPDNTTENLSWKSHCRLYQSQNKWWGYHLETFRIKSLNWNKQTSVTRKISNCRLAASGIYGNYCYHSETRWCTRHSNRPAFRDGSWWYTVTTHFYLWLRQLLHPFPWRRSINHGNISAEKLDSQSALGVYTGPLGKESWKRQMFHTHLGLHYSLFRASLVAQMVKRLPAMWETWVRSLGWEDPLEKETATHSSILAWKIPWTEKLVNYSPWGH